MKKKFYLKLFVSLLALSFHLHSVGTTFKQSASSNQKTVYAGSFTRVKVSGPFDIQLIQSKNEPGVRLNEGVEANKFVRVEVENDIAHIRCQSGAGFNVNIDPIPLVLISPDVCEVILDGYNTLLSKGSLNCRDFSLDKSGRGAVHLNINADNLTLVGKGNNEFHLSGQVQQAHLALLNRSELKAYDLMIENANVFAKGFSKIFINVKENLNVHLNNRSQVSYKGSPHVIVKQRSSASELHAVD